MITTKRKQKQEQWEYNKIHRLTPYVDIEILNVQGTNGWQLVCVTTDVLNHATAYFKRPRRNK